MRFCAHCDTEMPEDGPDACLGVLPDVEQACCGHGMSTHPYVLFTDGERFDGLAAIRYFESVGHAPSPQETFKDQLVEQHDGHVKLVAVRDYATGAPLRVEWTNTHPTEVPVWLVNGERVEVRESGSLDVSGAEHLNLETV